VYTYWYNRSLRLINRHKRHTRHIRMSEHEKWWNAKKRLSRARKHTNKNEVVSSYRLLCPDFPDFYGRRDVSCMRVRQSWELTLHACVTFNFRHNFLPLPPPLPFRRFSFFNDADSPSARHIAPRRAGRTICNWLGGSKRRCRRESKQRPIIIRPAIFSIFYYCFHFHLDYNTGLLLLNWWRETRLHISDDVIKNERKSTVLKITLVNNEQQKIWEYTENAT